MGRTCPLLVRFGDYELDEARNALRDPEFQRLVEEQVRQRRQVRKSRGLRDFQE